MKFFEPLRTQHVSLLRRRRPHPGGIAAGARFSQPPCPEDFPFHQPRQVVLLLRVVAEHVDVCGAQPVVRRDRQRDRRTDARQLFDADAVVDGRHRRPAVLLLELDPHQPEIGKLRQQLHREVLRLVPLHDVRPHLGFRELADGLAQELLLVGRAEVHCANYTGRAKSVCAPKTLNTESILAPEENRDLRGRWPRPACSSGGLRPPSESGRDPAPLPRAQRGARTHQWRPLLQLSSVRVSQVRGGFEEEVLIRVIRLIRGWKSVHLSVLSAALWST